MLDEEREYYNQNRSTWSTQYPEKYLLVKGKRLVGVYNSEDEAVSDGVRHFGLSSFLVRKAGAGDQEVSIPALALGILNANSSQSK